MTRSSSDSASRSTTGTGPYVSTACRQARSPVWTSPPPPAPSTEHPRASAGSDRSSICIAVLRVGVGVVTAGVLGGDVAGAQVAAHGLGVALRGIAEPASAAGVQVDAGAPRDPHARGLGMPRAGAVGQLQLQPV